MSLKIEQFDTDESAPPRKPDVAWLSEARKRKGLTLDHLASTTKITPKFLTALEAGHADKLPPAFFIRGFVKTYAKEVGLDPDSTAERYLAELLPPAAASEDVRAIVETAVARTGVIGYDSHHAPLINSLHPDPSGRLLWGAAAVAVIMYMGMGPLTWDGWTSDMAAQPAPIAAAPAPVSEPAPETPPATPAVDMAAGPLKFLLNPNGECWFSATTDGTQIKAELLQAGDKRPLEASDALVLRVGDPGACAFSINGRAGRALGSPGMPVTVRITKDNFRDFLSS